MHVVTIGFTSLPAPLQEAAEDELRRKRQEYEDWFYSLCGGKVFAAQNETGGYTLMLPEEY
jgi:hypothetical protein